MKNIDKIKTMNLDKMAKFLAYSECRICAFNNEECLLWSKDVSHCHKGIKQWLKEEENNVI